MEDSIFGMNGLKYLLITQKLGFWVTSPLDKVQYQQNPKKAHSQVSPHRLSHKCKNLPISLTCRWVAKNGV